MHAHDWPAAVVPVSLNTRESDGPFADTGSMLTIHNLGHQGIFPAEEFVHLPLAPELYRSAGFESPDGINLLQAGLENADILTTVSPTYAQEIQTPEYGCGLDALLRRRKSDLFGVLNGMDYEIWNPETDLHIPANFSHRNLEGKAVNKEALQRAFGLPSDPEVPLVAMVSRLADQKVLWKWTSMASGSLPIRPRWGQPGARQAIDHHGTYGPVPLQPPSPQTPASVSTQNQRDLTLEPNGLDGRDLYLAGRARRCCVSCRSFERSPC